MCRVFAASFFRASWDSSGVIGVGDGGGCAASLPSASLKAVRFVSQILNAIGKDEVSQKLNSQISFLIS